MARKLPGVLVFVLITMREFHMPEAYCSCSSTTYCSCNSLALTSIPQNLHPSITTLLLRDNQITTLDQAGLSRYTRLTTLDLENNEISIIDNQAFYYQRQRIQSLYLQVNNLKTIPSGIFVNLPMLQRLHLYSNQIDSIQSGAFSSLPQLQNLRLDDNNLHTISPGSFSGVGNLQQLQLQNNFLTNIPIVQYNFQKLTTLHLNNNSITHIPDHAFSNQPKLSTLYLHANRISSLSGTAFTQLAQLDKLYLYDNALEEIPEHLFGGLSNLHDLRLQNNAISHISLNSFTGISRLSHFYLSDNRLKSFPVAALSKIPSISRLNIQNNHIQILPLTAYSKLASISTTVNIENNPWQCDCRMVPFRQKMTGSRPFENQITCEEPSTFLGRKLKDVSPEDLICEEPTIVRFERGDEFVSDTKLVEGRTLYLVCESSGIPKPDITVILPSGLSATVESVGRVTVDANGNITVTDLTAVDAGSYTCIAASTAGTAFAVLSVTITKEVQPPPKTYSPGAMVGAILGTLIGTIFIGGIVYAIVYAIKYKCTWPIHPWLPT